jgi:hypothetical protein
MKLFLLLSLLIPLYGNGMGINGLDELECKLLSEDARKAKCTREIINTINERLHKNLDINAPMPNSCGQSPLHRAAWCDQTGSLVAYLLQIGANPNTRDDQGETPLCAGDLRNIKLLLQHGADPNILNNYKSLSTPLHMAIAYYNGKAAALLLAYGANPTIPNWFRESVFEKCKDRPALCALLTRIYHHKKQAYAWLLKGKSDQSESEFRRLPSDCVKKIIDSICPGYKDFPWPQKHIPIENMLEYLKSVPGNDTTQQ